MMENRNSNPGSPAAIHRRAAGLATTFLMAALTVADVSAGVAFRCVKSANDTGAGSHNDFSK